MDLRNQQPEAAPRPASPMAAAVRSNPTPKLLWWLLTVLAVFAIAFSLWQLAGSVLGDHAINRKEYQAIFLPGNVVYFGKLSNVNGSYIKLTDIYYLQQSSSGSNNVQSGSSNSNNQVSLVKLGSELHAPEDAMYIAKDQVLFWENLKNSGKVAQAIQQYKSGNK